jgi:acetyl-CoA carboxylase biotin carboxyl carrier protein
MILTAKDIAEITRLLDESHFSELKLEIGEFKLRISRSGAAPRDDYDDEEPDTVDIAHPIEAPAGHTAPASAGKGEVDVPSPLLGNFYHSPRPGDPPFVVPGDAVSEDTTIGIVEVMKLMNPIRAGVAGTVVDYLAANGSAVEKDQPLIRVKVG